MSYTTNLEIQDEIIGKMGLGVDYYKGEPGEQGIPGKTPVKGVDYFTDAEIAEIKDEIAEKVQVGAKGEDGKTPVKGVDYFTTAEIQQIENEAAAKVDLSDYAKTADLSTVATSGSYNDLSDKPSIPKPYELPVASATALGGVKVGSGLSITNGVLSATGGGTADSVDWSKIQNKPDFADVATSGSYNDLADKPTIPSTTGLATETYVDDKIAEIDIPTVPTKVSAFTNDAGYLTEHQSLIEYAKKTDIPAPYTLPTASTSTLGGVKVDGNTITIADGVISSVGGSGCSEPEKYIKDASVSGNTLTLTKKDDTEVVFTPSGGGSSAVYGYAFTSGKTLTSEDKAHILEIKSNPLIPMYINGNIVSGVYDSGNYLQFRVIEIKGVGNDCFSAYTVNYNQSGITSNELNLQMQWYIASSNGTIDGDLITSYNLKDQIKQNAGWSYTTDSSESDLYNAKEMVLIGINAMNENFQQYYNFSYESNQNEACLGSDYQNITYTITVSNSNNITWNYNGSSIDTSAVIRLIIYKA